MDISFKIGLSRFNYRVGCIPVNNGKVLLHKGKEEDYWTVVGGRVKTSESSAEALKREIMEELGQEIEVHRLISISENFFIHNKEDFHELLFIYLISFNLDSAILESDHEFSGLDDGKEFSYKWFDNNEIAALSIKPYFLKEMLNDLPKQLTHIIENDKL